MKPTHSHLHPCQAPPPPFKLLCSQHNQQISKVCTKVNCKYKRFLCRYCITSSNHRKHLSEHPEMDSFSQILSPIEAPDIIGDIMSNAHKYFTYLLSQVFKTESVFKKRHQELYEQFGSMDQLCSHLPDYIWLTKGISNKDGSYIQRILSVPEELTDQPHNLNNFTLPLFLAKRQMAQTLTCLLKSTSKIISNLRTRNNIFTNTIRFKQNLDIADHQDLKRIKQGTFSIYNISVSFPRQPLANYTSQIIMNKINTLPIKQLTLSLVNIPVKDILKIELPVECKAFNFIMKRKVVNKKLIQNLKAITQDLISDKFTIGEEKNHFTKIHIDLLECNIEKQSVVVLLCSWVGMFAGVKELKINLKLNKICKLGMFLLMPQISKLESIQSLDLDFGGFCQNINQLNGTMQIIGLSLRKLKHLRELKLGLSNTNISNSDIITLANQFLQLKSLQKLQIGIETNDYISEINQFIYKLSLCKMRSLILRLNGIKIKNSKLYFIIESFNESQTLKDLVIEAKNCNVLKEEGLKSQKGEKYRLNMSIIY